MGITYPANVKAREWRKENKRERVKWAMAAAKEAQEAQRRKSDSA